MGPPQRPASSSSTRSPFVPALNHYQDETGTRLIGHPLTKALEKCSSVDSITAILQKQAPSISRHQGDGGDLMKSLRPIVRVLYKLSTIAVLRKGISLPISPAKAILAAIGILLGAIKNAGASYDASAFLDMLSSFVKVFEGLEIYTKLPINERAVLGNIVVKIMAELLSILALATKQVDQRRLGQFLYNIPGEVEVEVEVEETRQGLDRRTIDDGRVTAAQTLEIVYGLTQRMRVSLVSPNSTSEVLPDSRERVEVKMTKPERDELPRDVYKWLSPPDPSINHDLAYESKHSGTAAWWIQDDSYAKWKSSGPSSLLWIHGKSGAGKSVLCSAIIEDIHEMRRRGQASLAFFYCDFREDQKKDQRSLVSSLLVQLGEQSDAYHAMLSAFFNTHGCGQEYASEAELVQCLKDMANIPGQATLYIIIDALDECPNMAGLASPREKVLKLVEDLVNLQVPNLRICVTSRPEADIALVLHPISFYSISLHDESRQIQDIVEYIRSVIDTDPVFRTWKAADKESVIDVLAKKADGIFRWVFCQLVYLRHCLPARIPRALDELPETLNETYARILEEIDEVNWEYAHCLLQCVAAASRPLRVEELAEFLAFDFRIGLTPKIFVEGRPEDQVEAVLSACSSLLSIVDVYGLKVIQFAHSSVKEYLTSSRLAKSEDSISRFHISMTSAHTIIAQTCLGVLLHLDENVTRHSLEKFPLAAYASEYWDRHVRFENVPAMIHDGMKSLFEPSQHHLAVWIGIYDPILSKGLHSANPLPAKATPLHYAAFCGFHDIVKFLIVDRSQDVNARGFDKETPLSVASQMGYFDIALSLLEHGADPNAHNVFKSTALHRASQGGHVDLARVLLEHGADPNAQDFYKSTALHLASQGGHVDLARVLLEHGADSNAQDSYKSTALHLASQGGHVDLARVFFEHGTDPNAQNYTKSTVLHLARQGGHLDLVHDMNTVALHLASKSGHLAVVRMLLEHGADANAQTDKKSTALHWSSQYGHLEVARVLLEHGADTEARDANECRPLHLASANGHLEIAQLLAGHGATHNVFNDKQETPLDLAAGNGSLEIVRLLIDHGANIGFALIHTALQNGHLDVVKLLLQRVADVESLNKHLHLASEHGSTTLMRLLIDHGANPNAEDEDEETPLFLTSRNGSVGSTQLLLEQCATVDHRNWQKETPLHAASESGHADVARLLLDQKAKVDAQNVYNWTPLHLGSRIGSHKTAEVLLEYSANVNAQNDSRWTPLHMACKKGHLDVVQLLLDSNASVDILEGHGETALHLAAYYGQEGVIQALLKAGAKRDIKNKKGKTPVDLAIQEDHTALAQLLR